jgi:hypothetical protein
MQIKRLHKNIYKLYSYARTQECLEKYRKLHQEGISKWEKLSAEKISLKLKEDLTDYLEQLTFDIHLNSHI